MEQKKQTGAGVEVAWHAAGRSDPGPVPLCPRHATAHSVVTERPGALFVRRSRNLQRAKPTPISPPHSFRRGRCRRTCRPGRGRWRPCCPARCRCCLQAPQLLLLMMMIPLLSSPARAACARGRPGAASCCRWPATAPRVWRGGWRRSRCWGPRSGPGERGKIKRKHVWDSEERMQCLRAWVAGEETPRWWAQMEHSCMLQRIHR